MNYFRLHIFSLLLGLTVMYAPVAGRAADFQSVLAGIDHYYESIRSLRAEFSQVVEVPALEKSETFSGTLYFLKPNLIRLEYSKPAGQLLVADGTDWWFYMPRQEIPQAMHGAGGDLQVYVLGGRMAQRFDGRLLKTASRGGAECYVLELKPKGRNAYYRSLRAWVDRLTFATRAVRYLDETGNFNTFDLGVASTDTPLAPELFSFTPPANAQVLEADSPAGSAGP